MRIRPPLYRSAYSRTAPNHFLLPPNLRREGENNPKFVQCKDHFTPVNYVIPDPHKVQVNCDRSVDNVQEEETKRHFKPYLTQSQIFLEKIQIKIHFLKIKIVLIPAQHQ
jgi:hypothetical protein